MRIEILSDAEEDLVAGARFYERQGPGLGEYFLNSIYSDIDSLLIYAGLGYRDRYANAANTASRAWSRRFPKSSARNRKTR
jgi:hypothetical protein